MAVAFNNMPGNIKVPLFYAEFNPGGTVFSSASRHVILGYGLPSGLAVNGNLIEIGGTDPNRLFGYGSMLAESALAARRHDPFGSISVLPIPEPVGAVKPEWTITVGGSVTVGGTLNIFIGGERVSTTVAIADTPTTIAARMAANINNGYSKFNQTMAFTVTATAAAGVVTLVSRHGGAIFNQLSILQGLDGPEINAPSGVTLTIANSVVGAGDFDMASALAMLGGTNVEWLSSPWSDTAHLDATRSFFADTGTGAWSPTVQKNGHYLTTRNGTLAALTAFGTGRNDAHASVLGTYNYATAPWVTSATLGGIVARSKNLSASLSESVEIARPLHSIVMEGVRGPRSMSDIFNQPDRQALYTNGIAGAIVKNDGQVALDRVVTTYQRNPFGGRDETYLDVETLAISAYVGRYFRSKIEATYPRHVLRDDNPGNLQGVATPDSIRGTCLHAYRELSNAGIVENFEAFARNLIIERSSDANRVNGYLPIDVANQMRVFAANITIFTQTN